MAGYRQKDFDYVVKHATSTKGLCNQQRMQFHYFNPNGLYEKVKANDAKVSKLVDEGVVRQGWLWVYGNLGFDYLYDQMGKLSRQRYPSSVEVRVWEQMVRDHIKKQEENIQAALEGHIS